MSCEFERLDGTAIDASVVAGAVQCKQLRLRSHMLHPSAETATGTGNGTRTPLLARVAVGGGLLRG